MRLNRKAPFAAMFAASATIIAAGGLAVAVAQEGDLEDRIDSAQSEAQQISDRVASQGARIQELQDRISQARARQAQLEDELAEATERSTELGEKLVVVERELEKAQGRYDRAVDVLADRLVVIYKTPAPDLLGVVLEADDFGELQSNTEYIEALNEADERAADRVEELRDEVDAHVDEIADLKAGVDEERAKLTDAREQIDAERAAADSQAAELAAAKAEGEAALADLRERISGWELEVRKAAAEEIAGSGGEAFLGGPYSIPTYIVMCESGGNYRALNPSSMAGGAYQIIPSTWQAYGGEGQYAHLASKAEQDRVAAIIWREDGPGAWSCA